MNSKQILTRILAPLALCLALWAPGVGAEPAIDARPMVNINQASADELAEALQGVGLTRAEAIVADREQHGAFGSAAELARVPGIGPATVERNRAWIQTD